EVQVGRLREQPRHCSLAGAGRPPEDERAQRTGIEEALERAIGAEQMVLADDFVQRLRPQLVGKGPRRVALEPGSRKQAFALRAPALGARRCHPRSSPDICWPPRMMVMRHSRLGWPATFSRSRVLAILVLLTERTRSPRWKPRLCAGEPFAVSMI